MVAPREQASVELGVHLGWIRGIGLNASCLDAVYIFKHFFRCTDRSAAELVKKSRICEYNRVGTFTKHHY